MKQPFISNKTLLLLLLLPACRREAHHGQYSTWIINHTDTFRTNEVSYSSNKAGTGLATASGYNGFTFRNGSAGMPYNAFTPGTHLLSPETESNDPELCRAYFYYKGDIYTPSPDYNDTLIVTLENDKYRFTMRPSWFIHGEAGLEDSIIIEGVFNEP